MNLNLIYDFIQSCDQVLGDLQTAQQAEMMDASSDNGTLFGFGVTVYSNCKNRHASWGVDQLQQKAIRLNQTLHQTGVFQRGGHPLPTDFSGAAIMHAENSEHSFWANLFTSGNYSSIASVNTLQQINHTIAKVHQVRSQATHLSNIVQYGQPAPMPPMPCVPNSYVR